MMSHFSSWKDQGVTIRISPSRIQTRFLIFPLIRPMRVTPSQQRTRIWFAPIIRSAKANCSLAHFLGRRTRTAGVPSAFTAFGSASSLLLLGLIQTTPLIYISMTLRTMNVCIVRGTKTRPGQNKKRNDNKFARQPFFTRGQHQEGDTSMVGIKMLLMRRSSAPGRLIQETGESPP